MRINRNTVNLWYNRFREAIVRLSIEESKDFKERYECGWESSSVLKVISERRE